MLLSETKPLGEMAQSITVGFVGPMAMEYVENGIPFLRSLNVRPFRFESSNLKYVTKEFHEKIKKSALHPGDVVVVRTGNPGASCVIPKTLSEANCSDLVVIRCGEKLDPYFVSYYINSVTHSKVKSQLVGAIQKHFNIGSAKELSFPIVSRSEQSKIIAILKALDAKIELNTRINNELEALARTLYDYWFVQFDFPDLKGRPYKSSGGKMVYNKAFNREVPIGWDCVPIDYFVNIIDPHPSHRAPKEVKTGYPFVGIGDIDIEGNISTEKTRKIDETFVLKQEQDYEINEFSLGYGRVGTVGKVVKLRKQEFRYALSPTLSVINPKDTKNAGYIYNSIRDKYFYKNVLKNTTGTTRPSIGIQELRKIPVLKPCDSHSKMFKTFEGFSKKLLEKASVTNRESQRLIQLRNWLLPMLMNGQVSVI